MSNCTIISVFGNPKKGVIQEKLSTIYHTLDILFPQITMFIKAHVAFVFLAPDPLIDIS